MVVVAGGTQAGVRGPEKRTEGRRVAPHPPFPHPEGVKERRRESVETAKLCTPLENQESMLF